MTKLQRICLLALVCYVLLLAAACTTQWTQQAIPIIQLIEAAIPSALAIVAAFGVGIQPNVATQFTTWGNTATNLLSKEVVPLINQYDQAPADAKPGILTEINAIISKISDDLKTILPEIKVTDAATQAKIVGVVTAIQDEIVALTNLIPALQGKMAHDEFKVALSQLKTAKEFKEDYNAKASEFGDEYKIN